jgi:hypothetical protein
MIIALAIMTGVLVGCSGKVTAKGGSSKDIGHDVVSDSNDSVDSAQSYSKKGNESVVLVYDAKMDVYVVSGHDDCYYTAGQFYRKVQGAWEWSVCIDGPWKAVERRNDLPPGLRKHKA